MKNCPECGHKLADSALFCDICGHEFASDIYPSSGGLKISSKAMMTSDSREAAVKGDLYKSDSSSIKSTSFFKRDDSLDTSDSVMKRPDTSSVRRFTLSADDSLGGDISPVKKSGGMPSKRFTLSADDSLGATSSSTKVSSASTAKRFTLSSDDSLGAGTKTYSSYDSSFGKYTGKSTASHSTYTGSSGVRAGAHTTDGITSDYSHHTGVATGRTSGAFVDRSLHTVKSARRDMMPPKPVNKLAVLAMISIVVLLTVHGVTQYMLRRQGPEAVVSVLEDVYNGNGDKVEQIIDPYLMADLDERQRSELIEEYKNKVLTVENSEDNSGSGDIKADLELASKVRITGKRLDNLKKQYSKKGLDVQEAYFCRVKMTVYGGGVKEVTRDLYDARQMVKINDKWHISHVNPTIVIDDK